MQREKYKWKLAEGIKCRLSECSYGRQRAIYAEEQLLLVLHEPPKFGDKDRKALIFLREKDAQWWCNGHKKCENRLIQLLENYRQKLAELEKAYLGVTCTEELFVLMENLNPLLRAARNMDSALQSAREQVGDDKFILQCRDQSNDIYRNYDLLGEEMKMALEYRIAKNAESQINESQKIAKSQHKLNLMAAITFPIMAMSSIFGMNLLSGFESLDFNMFWVMMGIGFSAGVLAMKWVSGDQK